MRHRYTAVGVLTIAFWGITHSQPLIKVDPLWIRPGHGGQIRSVDISSDGRWAVSSSSDETIKVWELPVGTLRYVSFQWRTFEAPCALFTRDSRYLVHATERQVRVVRLGSWETIYEQDFSPFSGPRHIAVAADGNYMVGGTGAGYHLWDMRTWNYLGTRTQIGNGTAYLTAISPDGLLTVYANLDGSGSVLYFYDTLTGNPIGASISVPGEVRAMAFSPDGGRFIHPSIAGSTGTVSVRLMPSRQLIYNIPAHANSVVSFTGFTPDGSEIVSASTMGQVRFWNATVSNYPRTREVNLPLTARVSSVAVNPDKTLALIGGQPRGTYAPYNRPVLYLARLQPQIELIDLLQGHRGFGNGLAISPDRQRIATSSTDGTIKFWRVSDGALERMIELRDWTEDTLGALRLAWSPTGNAVAALVDIAAGRTVRLYNPDDGSERFRIPLDFEPLSLAFSPDGRLLAVGGASGNLRVWDVSGVAPVLIHTARLGNDIPYVRSVRFSPDGSLLAAAYDRSAFLISTANWQIVRAWQEPAQLFGVWFTPNGEQLLIVTYAPQIRLRETSTNNLLVDLNPAFALDVLFSRDGQYVYLLGNSFMVASRPQNLVYDLTRREWVAGFHIEVIGSMLAGALSASERSLLVLGRDGTVVRSRAPFAKSGDVTGDGCANDADLLRVLFRFGESGFGLSEDLNEDGVVDDADLLEVLFHFGEGCED